MTFITTILCTTALFANLNRHNIIETSNRMRVTKDCNITRNDTVIGIVCKGDRNYVVPVAQCSISRVPTRGE